MKILIIPQKEQFDEKVVDSALRTNSNIEAKELKTHIVYAGEYYYHNEDRLKSFILQGLKKFKIKSVMMTIIHMHRYGLITKEVMENYYKGEKYEKTSVNDDLESFFEDLRLGKEPNEYVKTYFLPKLTEEEMALVERKDPIYLGTFQTSFQNPDVKEAEMTLSESNSKFVYGWGRRRTFTIEN